MTVYHHLAHALRIMREEADWRNWGQLIDALTPEQQAEVRPWLRQEAQRRGGRPPASKAFQPPSFPANSTRQGKNSRPRRAART